MITLLTGSVIRLFCTAASRHSRKEEKTEVDRRTGRQTEIDGKREKREERMETEIVGWLQKRERQTQREAKEKGGQTVRRGV